MKKFNNKNFIELLKYTEKFFFQKLGNKSSKNLENKFRKYYSSKIKKNKLISIDISEKKKLIWEY